MDALTLREKEKEGKEMGFFFSFLFFFITVQFLSEIEARYCYMQCRVRRTIFGGDRDR